MNAIEIYKKLSQPPATALREITDGKLKGKTDINPQWRYEAMTETFGLVGLGWKYEIQKLWTEKGAGNEVLAFAQVAVFVRDPETKEWSDPIVGIGGSKLINDYQRGSQSNDEGYKMAVTDAFSTSLKMIGVAADIYAGRWDGTKYMEPGEEPAPQQNQNQKQQQKKAQEPAGGPDTPQQRKIINELVGGKYPDGSKIFSKKEIDGLLTLRMNHTAGEVIQELRMTTAERLAHFQKQHEQPQQEAFEEDIPYDESPLTAEEAAGANTAFETN